MAQWTDKGRKLLEWLARIKQQQRVDPPQPSHFDRPEPDRKKEWRQILARRYAKPEAHGSTVVSGQAAKHGSTEGRQSFNRIDSEAYKKELEIKDRFKDDDLRATALDCLAEAMKAKDEHLKRHQETVAALNKKVDRLFKMPATPGFNDDLHKQFQQAKKTLEHANAKTDLTLLSALSEIGLSQKKWFLQRRISYQPSKAAEAPAQPKPSDAGPELKEAAPSMETPQPAEPEAAPTHEEDIDWVAKFAEEDHHHEVDHPDLGSKPKL